MAAIGTPAPGSEYGPCRKACKHTDCASLRRQAETPCTACGKPIGYEVNFFRDNPEDVIDWTKLIHAMCLYRRNDARRRA